MEHFSDRLASECVRGRTLASSTRLYGEEGPGNTWLLMPVLLSCRVVAGVSEQVVAEWWKRRGGGVGIAPLSGPAALCPCPPPSPPLLLLLCSLPASSRPTHHHHRHPRPTLLNPSLLTHNLTNPTPLAPCITLILCTSLLGKYTPHTRTHTHGVLCVTPRLNTVFIDAFARDHFGRSVPFAEAWLAIVCHHRCMVSAGCKAQQGWSCWLAQCS